MFSFIGVPPTPDRKDTGRSLQVNQIIGKSVLTPADDLGAAVVAGEESGIRE